MYAGYVLANLRLRCNVLILKFIPCNAGVFCCAIDLDFLLTRDRVEASQKNDFKGELTRLWELWVTLLLKKKNMT